MAPAGLHTQQRRACTHLTRRQLEAAAGGSGSRVNNRMIDVGFGSWFWTWTWKYVSCLPPRGTLVGICIKPGSTIPREGLHRMVLTGPTSDTCLVLRGCVYVDPFRFQIGQHANCNIHQKQLEIRRDQWAIFELKNQNNFDVGYSYVRKKI